MRACSPDGNAAAPVDLRKIASAIPSIGLAPDAIARAEFCASAIVWPDASGAWAWQYGSMLIVLDVHSGEGWQLSELSFDDAYGYYLEQRRSEYTSPREATGVALAWSMRMGAGATLSAAAALDAWSSFALSRC